MNKTIINHSLSKPGIYVTLRNIYGSSVKQLFAPRTMVAITCVTIYLHGLSLKCLLFPEHSSLQCLSH